MKRKYNKWKIATFILGLTTCFSTWQMLLMSRQLCSCSQSSSKSIHLIENKHAVGNTEDNSTEMPLAEPEQVSRRLLKVRPAGRTNYMDGKLAFAATNDLTNGYLNNDDASILNFSKILGHIPPSTLQIPFPFHEDKVIPYIAEKLCPKVIPRCVGPAMLSNLANTIHGDMKILLGSGGVASLDDVMWAYTQVAEVSATYSFINFLGVPVQQGPKDAFAIMDLLWRLKPDLLIELGTAGGGSAFFYGTIMTAYNPQAHVITIDPKRTFDWNRGQVARVCPHCVYARDTPFWKNSGVIEFINESPTSEDTLNHIKSRINMWDSKVVLVIEDSNHLFDVVYSNLMSYAQFVTPGSFMITQDTKMSRMWMDLNSGPLGAVKQFLTNSPIGKDFRVDRRFEYHLSSEHAMGFLYRREPNETTTTS